MVMKGLILKPDELFKQANYVEVNKGDFKSCVMRLPIFESVLCKGNRLVFLIVAFLGRHM